MGYKYKKRASTCISAILALRQASGSNILCCGGFAPTVYLITARILMAWPFGHNRIRTDMRGTFLSQHYAQHIFLFTFYCLSFFNIHDGLVSAYSAHYREVFRHRIRPDFRPGLVVTDGTIYPVVFYHTMILNLSAADRKTFS